MRRRRLLEMGVALASLPLSSCGGSPAQPAPTSNAGGKSAGASPPAPSIAVPPAAEPTGVPDQSPGLDPVPGPADAAQSKPVLSRVIAKVGRNHGHVFSVTFADVSAGVARTYDLTGSSGHPHAVTLSAEDMKALLDGQIVRMQSTRVGGHAHRLLVRCAPAVDPPEWVSACEIEVGGKDEHEMVIPAADMTAKAEKIYDIQGVAGHSHAVKVTAEDFRKLAGGEELTLTSSTSSVPERHAHLVFIRHTPPKKG
jgi:hypothetical protein